MTAIETSRSDVLLERFATYHPLNVDLDLTRVDRLLADLGNPQDALAPVVHVAGTNGKGSVIAYLRAMCEAAGYRVHVYTSPHLVHFHERIRLAGELISEETLVATLEEVERVNAGRPITYFEATTAAAFLAMSRVPADIVLLETGLGGRLDATNVVKRPALAVLTPISRDHEEYLGGTIEAIAAEKSFIMKHGTPTVTAKQERKVSRILEMRSLEMGCPMIKEGESWFARSVPGGLVFESDGRTFHLPSPVLVGAHQMRNAGLALAAALRLRDKNGFDKLDVAALGKGLQTAEWPGRLHKLSHGPLVDLLPDGWEIWLDGGHNEAAASVLSTAARTWRGKTLHMVLAMKADKDPARFVKAFGGPKIFSLRAVPFPDGGETGHDPQTIVDAALTEGARAAAVSADAAAAVEAIVGGQPGPGVILITGSLYLVGAVLRDNG